MNRSRDKAVYLKPEDAWGLDVWQTQPSLEIIARSFIEYDAFYATVKQVFADLESQSLRGLRTAYLQSPPIAIALTKQSWMSINNLTNLMI